MHSAEKKYEHHQRCVQRKESTKNPQTKWESLPSMKISNSISNEPMYPEPAYFQSTIHDSAWMIDEKKLLIDDLLITHNTW